MGWKETEPGEWYWPLHPTRQQDHLRVWKVPAALVAHEDVSAGYTPGHDGWLGALVVDGEYLDVCRTHPCDTAEQAKREVWAVAKLYLGVLTEGIKT